MTVHTKIKPAADASFDRAAVMASAWKQYRAMFARGGKEPFSRENFAYCLRCAWMRAKEALMPVNERRALAIRDEIDRLKYKSFHINIEPRRRALEAQLAALAG
jgi:hypothetical protein